MPRLGSSAPAALVERRRSAATVVRSAGEPTLATAVSWPSWIAPDDVEKAARSAATTSDALRRRILGESGPVLRAAILRAIAEAVGGATIRRVRAALEARNIPAAERAIPWERFGPAVLPVARVELRRALERTGALEGRLLLRDLRLSPNAFAFDVTEATAVNWVRTRSAEMVVGISDSRKGAIRRVLDRVLTAGLNEHDAARLLIDGKVIGLTDRDAGAVANMRARLRGDGVRADRADELAARYGRRLLGVRATRVAHHELVEAHGEGQLEGWSQARKKGLLDSRAVVRWNAYVDCCDKCSRVDGQIIRIGGVFRNGRRRPPAHVNCRCILTVHPFGLPARR